jgi:hypothetical protein
MGYVDVGGSFEAAWDGQSCVVLREKGTTGPNFHLTRQAVLELLGLFHVRSSGRDDFVLFDVSEVEDHRPRSCGRVALCLSWSEIDILVELRSRGYPLDKKDGRVAVFRGWPSDREFTLVWGGTTYKFVAQGHEQSEEGRT